MQKVVLQKKRELCKGNSSVVNVQSEIRTLLTSLLIAVNNHQVCERCANYSEIGKDLNRAVHILIYEEVMTGLVICRLEMAAEHGRK